MTVRGERKAAVSRRRVRRRRADDVPRGADLEIAYERLQHLYEISKLLTRYESMDRTVVGVLDLVARTLPLRSAVAVLETDGRGRPRTIEWHAAGARTRLRSARAHATAAYAYLVRPDGERKPEVGGELGARYVVLPLVVDRGAIFGVLQLDAKGPVDEYDVVFANAVVNQLAIAIDRQAMIDRRQDLSDQARTEAERKQVAAERAEDAARHELAFARDVAASLGEGVLAVDPELRVTLLNPAAASLLDCDGEAAIGRPVHELLQMRGPDGGPVAVVDCPFGLVIRRGEAVRSDERSFSRPHRGPFPVSYACAPLRRDGRVAGAVLAFRDVMDVKRAEREQRALADLSALLASSLELRGTFSAVARFAVPSLADVCFVDEIMETGGVRRHEIVGARGEDAKRFALGPLGSAPQADVLASGKPLLRAAGHESMMVVPMITRGKILGAITFGMVGSRRRYTERDLGLANEIGHRAALAVDNARLFEHSRQATAAREELLAVVSHDIKNPLGTIIMSHSALLRSVPPGDTRSREQLANIQRATERIERLIRNLLDAAKIDAGHLSVDARPVDLAPLVAECVRAMSALAADKRIRVETQLSDALPAVAADPSRIEQAFDNVLGNALKFTPEGGNVTVRAERSGESVTVSVTDDGPGIPEAERAHLFDRYWQASETAPLGTGLGLYIVKGIVEAHGGRVRVDSEVGVGSTFAFEIPIAR